VDFFPPGEKNSDGWVMVEHLADKPSDMSVDAWFAQVKQTANLNARIQEQRFDLNGLPALKVRYRNPSEGGYEMECVYVVSGSRTFEIEFSSDISGSTIDSLGNYPTYLQMLGTFKVTNPQSERSPR
jgi:hypothetical protein